MGTWIPLKFHEYRRDYEQRDSKVQSLNKLLLAILSTEEAGSVQFGETD